MKNHTISDILWGALGLAVAAVVLMTAAVPAQETSSTLERSFLHPPDSAKPHTWWHWMNGNITKEGITADLEAMARVGVGGAQIFNVGAGIGPGPVTFMSDEWRAMIKHAVQEADRVGVELCVHNCGGWSSSGGPWVKPEHAMQMVVWSEKHARGPGRFSEGLPQPMERCGFYRDIAVLAFRTPPAEAARLSTLAPQVTASADTFEAEKVFDGDLRTFASLPARGQDNPPYVQFEFPQPFTARCLTVIPGPGPYHHAGELQGSDDGHTFRRVASFSLPGAETAYPILHLNFEPVAARFFRLIFTRPEGGQVTLAEVDLHAGARVENLLGKAAFVRWDAPTMRTVTAVVPAEAVVDREGVLDLTDRLDGEGRLTWDVPEGDWTILRLGYTPTGKNNHPAPEGGEGLECDKLSREAMEAFFAGMMAAVIEESGPLAGKSLNNALIDSYEVGSQNWTPRFREEFQQRRGYDLFPYLPVLTGRVVASLEASERFLWDFRRTIADLFADAYFGHFAELCHRHGLLMSTEGYGNGPFDNLQCAGRADIPMSEFWTGWGGAGNAKEAASAAHTYGRKFVGAESFTSAPEHGRWQNHPYALKALGDLVYCAGVNRFIFHRYAHQPWLDRFPGMTMGPWGFHFERTVTWWNQSPAWLRYLARCQFLLQEGLFVGDLCYFYGEGASAGLGGLNPPPPPGYDYDGCNAEVLLTRLSVRDGRIVLPDGMSYAVLVLPDTDTMTPPLLRKVRELVQAGATVVGPKPVKSPSLTGYPACDEEVQRLAEEVWGDCDGKTVTEHACGQGRVFWGQPLEEVLRGQGLPPDFEFTSERGTPRLAYIHRRIGEVEVYFVSNQQKQYEAVACTFRVSGKAPELWHPDTGRIEKAPLFAEKDGRTTVPLVFEPAGSVFVVFRQPVQATDPVVSVTYNGGPLFPVRQKPPAKLEIQRAVYGVLENPQQCVDVTAQLAGMVQDNTLSVEASNRIAGDPAYGIVKKMRVDYTLDGVPQSQTVNENEILEIPASGADEPPAAELSVTGEDELELRAWEAGAYELRRASGQTLQVEVPAVPEPVEVGGPWELRFPPNWGAPEQVTLEKLISWTEHENPGVRYFSGTAEYVQEVEIPTDRFEADQALYLDLGRVQVIAEVNVNGQDLGVLWKPPFRVEITDVARPGRNRLAIKVTNLWPNRLIGDQSLPEDQRYTWTTWQHYTKDSPLLESGLLGPVEIVTAVRKRVAVR